MVSPYSDAGNGVFPPSDAHLVTVHPIDEASLRAALKEAFANEIPVTVAAALTGLTGAAVPRESGVRLDLTGFDRLPERAGWRRVAPFLLIHDTDPTRGLVAPGVSLQRLNEALDALNLWYPPHPGEVRASIGGNVSTNASGPRTFAFGATRDYVESLRIVLADGDVIALRRGEAFATGRRFKLRTLAGHIKQGELPAYEQPPVKNAAGLYAADDMDLLDLFVGCEGILGVFSEIGLRFLPRRPIRSEIFIFGSTEAALSASDTLRPHKARAAEFPNVSGDGLLALEFFDDGSLALVRDLRPEAVALNPAAGSGFPLIPDAPRAALEVETFADDVRTQTLVHHLASAAGCCGALPPDQTQAFRYAVPRRVAGLLKERGQPKFGTDFAVPLSGFRELYSFYEMMDREFDGTNGTLRTAKWGHVGDCHLHCNFLCESAEDQILAKALYLKLVRKAVALGGTISAEHGVGKKQLADESGAEHPYLWYLYGREFEGIAEVKRVFDPKGLLNRGNMVGGIP